MTTKIKLGKHTIDISTFDIQSGSVGRDFVLSATENGKEEQWVSGSLKKDTFVTYKYLDDGTFFKIHLDVNNKFIAKM